MVAFWPRNNRNLLISYSIHFASPAKAGHYYDWEEPDIWVPLVPCGTGKHSTTGPENSKSRSNCECCLRWLILNLSRENSRTMKCLHITAHRADKRSKFAVDRLQRHWYDHCFEMTSSARAAVSRSNHALAEDIGCNTRVIGHNEVFGLKPSTTGIPRLSSYRAEFQVRILTPNVVEGQPDPFIYIVVMSNKTTDIR